MLLYPNKLKNWFVSKQKPVPLSDVETEILCWSGVGVTGSIIADLRTTTGGHFYATWLGRTIPYACNVQSVKLFFTDDNVLCSSIVCG